MSRLTMLQKNGITNMVCRNEDCHTAETYCPCTITDQCDCPTLKEVIEKLAHYEDLEEQGRLIELPCKVGDTVWFIAYNEMHFWDGKPLYEVENTKFYLSLLEQIGNTVFITKEEAEAKLAEINNRDAINTEVNYSDAMNVYRELNTHDREKTVSELAELKGTEE